ncbi:MAG: hypothetical protein K0S55_502 [Clostridia bacterium]|nr:hypothetical protein [Clostridia bacterium]
MEISMGVYEGLTRAEAQEKYPEMWKLKMPEGREPIDKVEERVFRVLDNIKNKYYNKTVLVVTHGYVTKVINKYFKNPTDEEFRAYALGNCEFTTYDL